MKRGLILQLYKKGDAIECSNDEFNEFTKHTTKVGLKQRCVLGPLLFSIILDDTIEKQIGKINSGILEAKD